MRGARISHPQESGFHKTNPRLAGTVPPSWPAAPCFSRGVHAGSGPEHGFPPGPDHSFSLSHCIFSWKRFISPGKPASKALVSSNRGAWLRFHTGPSLQGSRSFACLRGGPERHAGMVFPCRGGETFSQEADEGLQMADRLRAAEPPPAWSPSGVAVRDSCTTFLLSWQTVCLG